MIVNSQTALIRLGTSTLEVGPMCLGTMTFGEQVSEINAHTIINRAVEHGITFWDTAELYSVPSRAETYGASETILGNWLTKNPGQRDKIVLSSKVAGSARGMPWIRNGKEILTKSDIVSACEGSLRRLKTDVIDLYQIHWPSRYVANFNEIYFDPAKDKDCTPILEQLEAMQQLVKAGKVREIGISNETPYGLHEFVRLSEVHNLPRVATVQNPYNLLNRSVENGLTENLYRLGVSLLPYSPLAFGLLTGKYDETGFIRASKRSNGPPPNSRAVNAARQYNALAKSHGLTPTDMALAFCNSKWFVASTVIGATSVAQLDACVNGFHKTLDEETLKAIDSLHIEWNDPAI